jgi:hypothetical protein
VDEAGPDLGLPAAVEVLDGRLGPRLPRRSEDRDDAQGQAQSHDAADHIGVLVRPQGCGPGFGEIDHHRLLHPLAFAGRPMPLCREDICAPHPLAPTGPEGIDWSPVGRGSSWKW